MKSISRRTCLKQLALAAAAGTVPSFCLPRPAGAKEIEIQPAPSESEAAAMAEIARHHMEQYHAPALSVAIARHGQFVYQRAFGLANQATKSPATPDNLFRIASVSKPITSAAIFTLIEQGRLHLDDLIFGPQGLFKHDFADFGGSHPDLPSKITLHHLLTHTCGGWANDDNDPMFRQPEMDHRQLITWTLRTQPLKNEPGTHYAYSNFGYCLLGRVIEKISGQPYAAFVRQHVLAKCGIKDMAIGANTLAQRAPGEVVYYGQQGSGTDPYNMNVARMDSHGGWIATPSDLVRFAMHVDGFQTTPSLLAAATIKTMTTATDANPNYACGWCVNQFSNWWHGGSLPGTLTILVRTASGLCWAAFTNTRVEGLNLDAMMWQMVHAVPAWKA
jgi:CubicO group peptidase (beta-lactamase class C family)